MVGMLPHDVIFSIPRHLSTQATNSHSSRSALLEVGNTFGFSSASLLSVPVGALHNMDSLPLAHAESSTLPGKRVSVLDKPPAALLERLGPVQHAKTMCGRNRLDPHLHAIAFDLQDAGWTPETIQQLLDVLVEIPDVFSNPRTIFDWCFLLHFEIVQPPDTAP